MLRSPLLAPRHYYRPFPSMDNPASNDLHWDTAYRPPSSTTQHSATFAANPDLAYPSPVTSASSYASPHSLPTSVDQAFAQIPSSIGPSRVLTRRQRAALEQGQTLGRRSAAPSTFPSLNTSGSPAVSVHLADIEMEINTIIAWSLRLTSSADARLAADSTTALIRTVADAATIPSYAGLCCSVFAPRLLRSLSHRVFV